MNSRSIGFKFGFWSALALLGLGGAVTGYALYELRAMAFEHREATLATATGVIANMAREQAALIASDIKSPLNASSTLAQALVAAARRDTADLTEADWLRLQHEFERIKLPTELARSSIQHLIDAVKERRATLASAQASAIEIIRRLRFDGDNYVWIQDVTEPYPRMIMHPIKPSLDGQVMDDVAFNTAQSSGQNLFVALNQATADSGKGYIHYAWPKPGATEPTPKLSFGLRIPEWGWVLGSGVWVDQMSFFSRDDINQILQAALAENPAFLGTFTLWEPNALDGRDQELIGAPLADEQGRFASSWERDASGAMTHRTLTIGSDNFAAACYQQAQTTKAPVVTAPRQTTLGGRSVMAITTCAPVLLNGQFRGVTGVAIGLDKITADVQEAASTLYQDAGKFNVLTADGVLVAASDTGVIADRPTKKTQQARQELDAARKAGEHLQLESTDSEDQEVLFTVVPINFGHGIAPWAAEISMPLSVITKAPDAALAKSRQSAIIMAAIALIMILAGTAAVSFIASMTARRVRKVSFMMKDIAEGDGDLTRQLPETGQDEIAELAQAFNLFQNKIRELVSQIAAGSARLAAASRELSSSSTATSDQVTRQQSETDQVATAMNEMTATVAEVARHAATAADSARAADQQASGGSSTVTNTIEDINKLSAQIESSASVVKQLSEDSESIGQVLDVIRGVADQTNLLALNAAIEAARAGEQGRGFAVVADEVRTLASRTQDSTAEIQTMIERLQSVASSAADSMESARSLAKHSVGTAGEAGEVLRQITEAVANIRDMNTQIATATEEQSAVAAEVDRNLVNNQQAIEAIAEGASQINRSAGELAQLAAEQQNRISRFTV